MDIPCLHRQLSQYQYDAAKSYMLENGISSQCIDTHNTVNGQTIWYVIKREDGEFRCVKTLWVNDQCIQVHVFTV